MFALPGFSFPSPFNAKLKGKMTTESLLEFESPVTKSQAQTITTCSPLAKKNCSSPTKLDFKDGESLHKLADAEDTTLVGKAASFLDNTGEFSKCCFYGWYSCCCFPTPIFNAISTLFCCRKTKASIHHEATQSIVDEDSDELDFEHERAPDFDDDFESEQTLLGKSLD